MDGSDFLFALSLHPYTTQVLGITYWIHTEQHTLYYTALYLVTKTVCVDVLEENTRT